jgi:hypothetical protein
MPKLSGQADQDEIFKLASALIDMRWCESEGFVNGQVTAEIRAINVGDGAEIKLTLRDKQGAALGDFSGQMLAGLHRRRIPLTDKCKGGVFFEASLPKHGLSGVGPKLPVGPGITLGKPEWKNHEDGSAITLLRRGMELDLKCPAPGIPDGKEASFAVLRCLDKAPGRLMARVPAVVAQEAMTVTWVFDYTDATLALGSQGELKPTGEKYAKPQIQLIAECLGVTSEGPKVDFEDIQRIQVTDADGVPVPGQKVRLYLADGSMRKASADGEGEIVLTDAPPGRISVVWELEGE